VRWVQFLRVRLETHLRSYVPGWDCHGLPIENKTLKDLGVDVSQLTSSEIRAAAFKTASKEIESQKAQFRTLGIMADWDSQERTYRTLGVSQCCWGRYKAK